MVVIQTESRAGLWMGEFEARDYRACRRCRPLPDRARLLKRVSCSARKLAPEFQGAPDDKPRPPAPRDRSEEHTSELQSLMRISYAVFCLKKKNSDLLH